MLPSWLMGVVLVVDDDFDFLRTLSDTLTDEGWKVLVGVSASAALRAARSCRVDVVLTDVVMPFGTGRPSRALSRAILSSRMFRSCSCRERPVMSGA